ncbi:LytR/AlgR family response regulator transcription factor [Anaerotruncus colihominis]|mgnify:FL=1|uniref:Stage 0 sporulation protein A homolog n=1 Tax=Anaerotruncus colihominis TaxID=169435 RepID=A0A845T1J5_9FIRM|nr:LytTR family DNA-binding domain-containing protein [Anaerotruncus colihominis]MCR2026456.1 LytTR family DNA-binding domain-containing protein [Anaerotruncus colihominis]NDO40764.1 response regulator transcription factor [Anaerotruncus colihominis]
MIRIAICDDEANTRAYLSSLIRAQSCPCEIVEYASASDCLADTREIDLLFLDIELAPSGDRLDGMALARTIRERATGTQPVIIFVTGYERYVFDAFDVGAFQYLLKPVDEEKFAQVFTRAVAQIGTAREKPGPVLTLQSANASKTIPLDSICYIESSNHKVELHLKDGEFACYAKIGDLEVELQDQFFRIHKGYLVNLSYVDGYSKSEVTLTNGERLLLSKYKYQDFVKAYLRFLKRGAGL